MKSLLSKVNFKDFHTNPFYKLFHGDLQFDNVIYNSNTDEFIYIDWRESFAGLTTSGDLYYDLAKLYGGCLIPYNSMKDENNIIFLRGEYSVNYSFEISHSLIEFKSYLESWITKNNFDLKKVKLLTSIIFLNMAPLHDEKFSKMLWFKSIELMSNYDR
jgi:thiamine kinase-like enzyme